ncbi:MAG: MFS transporter [Lachnospiraceae bacterium]|nr:MFS transporter [Lachnospiraceae bacterium]
MSQPNYKRTRLACYVSYFTMSSIFSLPPLLFVTFREMYGISYTLLGTLVLVNFCTQLSVDLIFSFFSSHFNVHKIVKVMPLITSAGLALYAIVPTLFPDYAYAGLLLGTVIFSISAGLSEVLLSPVIAALPSENPQRDMSMLHSLYAFGVFTIVLVSTLFLKLFGTQNWMYLTLLLAALPVFAAVLFMTSPMPDMTSSDSSADGKRAGKKTVGLALCIACIFFGSCAENAMSNWISGYMENALHIDKAVGDILGMAMFAILLGGARISYARWGKNICAVLLTGMIGAAVCYLIAGLSTSTIPAFLACILTGVFTAMLWPGTLIMMEENIPDVGVAAYALMAAGGDLGASIAPQLLGIVVDQVSASEFAAQLGGKLSLSTEQIGMKAGMLVTALFPICGTVLLIFIIRYFRKTHTK